MDLSTWILQGCKIYAPKNHQKQTVWGWNLIPLEGLGTCIFVSEFFANATKNLRSLSEELRAHAEAKPVDRQGLGRLHSILTGQTRGGTGWNRPKN